MRFPFGRRRRREDLGDRDSEESKPGDDLVGQMQKLMEGSDGFSVMDVGSDKGRVLEGHSGGGGGGDDGSERQQQVIRDNNIRNRRRILKWSLLCGLGAGAGYVGWGLASMGDPNPSPFVQPVIDGFSKLVEVLEPPAGRDNVDIKREQERVYVKQCPNSLLVNECDVPLDMFNRYKVLGSRNDLILMESRKGDHVEDRYFVMELTDGKKVYYVFNKRYLEKSGHFSPPRGMEVGSDGYNRDKKGYTQSNSLYQGLSIPGVMVATRHDLKPSRKRVNLDSYDKLIYLDESGLRMDNFIHFPTDDFVVYEGGE
ncbi:MAG: hypothetical protein KKF56_03520 [Nanoarchaeota archaeon]|nr:hypothetical protein [Nanoarchaeota archaeon]